MNEKENIIEAILEIELPMFLNVNSSKTSGCQEDPQGFRLHRHSQFAPWSRETLESYLDDLRAAKNAGQNLMREKYARMQGLIGNKNSHPVIDEILKLTVEWQKEMFRKYPALMSGARPLTGEEEAEEVTSFETYERGEMETYSVRTLELLHADMVRLKERGANWSEEIYESLVRGGGYPSLAEAERRLEAKRQRRRPRREL